MKSVETKKELLFNQLPKIKDVAFIKDEIAFVHFPAGYLSKYFCSVFKQVSMAAGQRSGN